MSLLLIRIQKVEVKRRNLLIGLDTGISYSNCWNCLRKYGKYYLDIKPGFKDFVLMKQFSMPHQKLLFVNTDIRFSFIAF